MLAASSAGAAECLVAGAGEVAVEGALSQWTFEDGAGRPEQAFILALPETVCLTGPTETDNVPQATKIHVYTADPDIAAVLKGFLGENVQVHGKVSGAHSDHHHARIVLDVTRIDAL